jgi:hypothetical protein
VIDDINQYLDQVGWKHQKLSLGVTLGLLRRPRYYKKLAPPDVQLEF